MNSNDQEIIPQEGTSEGGEQSSNNLIEVNGKQLTIEELKAGYMMQSDYTRKMQEIANERKKPENDTNADLEVAFETLKKDGGFVTKGDLERIRIQTEREIGFNELLRTSPELKKQEQIIRKLATADNIAFEDAIVKYGLADMNKLQKAKNSQMMVGTTDRSEPVTKSISEMTHDEYIKWKNSNTSKFEGNKFNKAKTIGR